MTKTIGKIAVGLLLALLTGAARPAANPATRPAAEAGYADVRDLGSADFAIRQAATRRLWRAGVVADPFLKAVAGSDNPETAERAAALLKYIDEGIVPSTPPEVIRLLDTYRQAPSPEQQNAAIAQLSVAGTDGVRILLRLRDGASSLDRVRIDGALAQSPRVAVALLLREQNRAEAEALINWRGSEDDSVAYWLIRGQLHDRIEMYRREGETRMLSHVELADGDASAALRDARVGANVDLIQRILIAQADWPGLAKQMQADAAQPSLLFEGTRALACRFAGDAAEADKIIAPISEAVVARRNPNAAMPGDDRGAAAALCINDRPGEALTALLDAGMRGEAADFMQSQLRYKQLLGLREPVDPGDADAVRREAQFAGVLNFLGEHAKAQAALADAADANSHLHDMSIAGVLCQSAVQMHRTHDVDAFLIDALTHNNDADSWTLDMANIRNPDDAIWWWRALRDRDDPNQAIQAVRAVANQRASKADAARLAEEVEAWSQTQPGDWQPSLVHAIVAAMKIAGAKQDQIVSLIRDHAQACPSVDLFLALGDALADLHQWPAAAEAFGQAVELDPARPMSVFLHGWAMTQAGDTKAGKEETELAHLLPLGDMQLRLDLFTAARDRGLTDDADRERKLIFALGDPEAGPMIELYRTCAGDAEKRHDYASAERYSRQELMGLLGTAGQNNEDQFVWNDLPGQIHRFAALADLAAGKPDAALAEASIYYKDLPDDVDGLIGLVRLADAAGNRKQADALFKMGHDTYLQLCHDYPESGGLHNQLAWAETRCRRNLDDALQHAKRTVTLEPENIASLDTLAETYYQRHEFQHAIDTIHKCIELDPADPHARKQLARFQLALKTGVADDD